MPQPVAGGGGFEKETYPGLLTRETGNKINDDRLQIMVGNASPVEERSGTLHGQSCCLGHNLSALLSE
jgi:hypothetical protein